MNHEYGHDMNVNNVYDYLMSFSWCIWGMSLHLRIAQVDLWRDCGVVPL